MTLIEIYNLLPIREFISFISGVTLIAPFAFLMGRSYERNLKSYEKVIGCDILKAKNNSGNVAIEYKPSRRILYCSCQEYRSNAKCAITGKTCVCKNRI